MFQESPSMIAEKRTDFRAYPLLYVDDESLNLEAFRFSFESDFTIFTAESAVQGLELLQKHDIGLVITDERMPGMSGIEFLQQVVERWPNTVRIIISAYSDADLLLRAINTGRAHEYIIKPWDTKKLKQTLINSLEMVKNRKSLLAQAELSQILQHDQRTIGSPDEMVCESSALKAVVDLARKVAQADVPVLISGETGTGKEVVAQLIHDSSERSHKPFVKVNCGALSEGLLESELFGHERGAFTGAVKEHRGRFELANGGTIFLDEIGDISPKLQLSLLRVLQEGTFERVGSTRTVAVNVRVISATHQNLEEMVAAKTFRSDLYFRLKVVPIEIPPLRERPADIEPLFHHFIIKYKQKFGLSEVTIEPGVGEHLRKYPWPGNVRELENAVQRVLVTLGNESYITTKSFSFDLGLRPESTREQMHRELEEKMRVAFHAAEGNCTQAAKALGMPRSTFRSRARKLGLI